MDLNKIETQKLMELYRKIQDFLEFLEKEENDNKEQ